MRSIWMSIWVIVLGLNSLCAQETIAPEVKKLPFIRFNYQSGGALPTNNFGIVDYIEWSIAYKL